MDKAAQASGRTQSRLAVALSMAAIATAGPGLARDARYADDATSVRVGMPIIVAKGVRKTYESGRLRVEALRGVDLVVRRGEMVAIMGPSGCGKTTLLNCLSGLDDLSGGDVQLEAQSLAGMSDVERTRLRSRRMGFVFQSFNLLPVLTAQENVELPLLVSQVKPAQAAARAMAALERVGLGPFAGHKPRELSGGQQQRVALARSLVNDPAIVWADEPTGNLDTQKGRDILALMHSLNRDLGQTYVIVTHDEAVATACHRIIHMEDGRIVRERQGSGSAHGQGPPPPSSAMPRPSSSAMPPPSATQRLPSSATPPPPASATSRPPASARPSSPSPATSLRSSARPSASSPVASRPA